MASEPLFYVMFNPPREWHDRLLADTADLAPNTTLDPYDAYPVRSHIAPMTRSAAERFIALHSDGHEDWYHLEPVTPVITHGPDEPMPAEMDWTAEDQDRWEWRMARGFPERDYTDPAARGFPGAHDDRGSAGQPVGLDGEDAATPALAAQPPADPPFLSPRASQFVSGFQAATRAIEADR